jgi:predicted DNA-binding transcriptional regulator AlpA
MTQQPTHRIMRLDEVEITVGLKRQQIWNLESVDDFPRRFKILGGRINGWDSVEIAAWVQARIDGPRVTLGSKSAPPPRGSVRKARASKAAAA